MDIPVQVHLDIVAAALNGFGEFGVFTGSVHPADEIIVHGDADGGKFVNRIGIHGALNVGISHRVCLIRADTALDGCPADNGAEHNGADLSAAERILCFDPYAVGNIHGGAERVLVIEIPQLDHFQHGLLRTVYPVTVCRSPALGLTRSSDVLHKHIADVKLLPGNAVVEHPQIPGEDGILAGGNPVDCLVKAAKPGGAVSTEILGGKPPVAAVDGSGGIKNRADHMAAI